jgi:hypothetical protein
MTKAKTAIGLSLGSNGGGQDIFSAAPSGQRWGCIRQRVNAKVNLQRVADGGTSAKSLPLSFFDLRREMKIGGIKITRFDKAIPVKDSEILEPQAN